MSAEPKRVELTEAEREVDPYQMNDLFGYVDAMVLSHWPPDEIALTLLLLGYTPEDEVERIKAAARREALQEAIEDIRERRRRFAGLGCDEQYLLAMDDCFGLVNNRLSAVLAEPERDEEGGND
jgi:hypothetical protein